MEAQTKQPNECCFLSEKEVFEFNNGIIINLTSCQVVRVGCNLGTQSGDVVVSELFFLQAGGVFLLCFE
jgi:hypothetical protein